MSNRSFIRKPNPNDPRDVARAISELIDRTNSNRPLESTTVKRDVRSTGTVLEVKKARGGGAPAGRQVWL